MRGKKVSKGKEMSLFDRYIKFENFDEKGMFIEPKVGDIQYFTLEELYQEFKERYDREKGNYLSENYMCANLNHQNGLPFPCPSCKKIMLPIKDVKGGFGKIKKLDAVDIVLGICDEPSGEK
jgi:hypothetical protein